MPLLYSSQINIGMQLYAMYPSLNGAVHYGIRLVTIEGTNNSTQGEYEVTYQDGATTSVRSIGLYDDLGSVLDYVEVIFQGRDITKNERRGYWVAIVDHSDFGMSARERLAFEQGLSEGQRGRNLFA